jgi:uridylate kinase
LGGAVAVKVSGKFIDPSNPGYVSELCGVLRELVSSGYRVAVIVGGGGLARRYIDAARRIGVSEALLDSIGIEASRLNALLVASGLGDLAYPSIPRSFEDFLRAWATGKVVVLGGLQPGQSTMRQAESPAGSAQSWHSMRRHGTP